MKFDHIAIATTDLETGTKFVEDALGVALLPGGRHARYGTHNTLLGLGEGIYLEVIAVDPLATPAAPRWFGLDEFDGQTRAANWICAVPDLEAAKRAASVDVGQIQSLRRDDLTWRIAVPDDGSLPAGGAHPTLIEWPPGITPPGRSLPDSGVRLLEWHVQHPDAEAIKASLPALDYVTFRTGRAALRARLSGPNGEVIL